jgi:hypothetical protein
MKGPVHKVSLAAAPEGIPLLFPLLREGFWVEVRTGCSVKEILCRDLGLTPEYVEGRIQTVFLDGRSVDDFESSIVQASSTLALSAAMPGLAGATLRKGGRLAAFRREITQPAEVGKGSNSKALIRLKLFNLLVDELGPAFLEKGVLVEREALVRLLASLPPSFWKICGKVNIDGRPVPEEAPAASLQDIEGGLVLLRAVKSTPSL